MSLLEDHLIRLAPIIGVPFGVLRVELAMELRSMGGSSGRDLMHGLGEPVPFAVAGAAVAGETNPDEAKEHQNPCCSGRSSCSWFG